MDLHPAWKRFYLSASLIVHLLTLQRVSKMLGIFGIQVAVLKIWHRLQNSFKFIPFLYVLQHEFHLNNGITVAFPILLFMFSPLPSFLQKQFQDLGPPSPSSCTYFPTNVSISLLN